MCVCVYIYRERQMDRQAETEAEAWIMRRVFESSISMVCDILKE